jgi:hypothetical protein
VTNLERPVLIGSMSPPDYSSASCFPAELASASSGALSLQIVESSRGLPPDQTQLFFYSRELQKLAASEWIL